MSTFSSNGSGSTIAILEKLGEGGYGTVHRCIDENNIVMAVKVIRIDVNETGIPNILETSIMSTIHHANLNRAIRIHCVPDNLYIFQEIATTDLSKYTRQNILSIEQLKAWCFSLAQGTACLHKHSIIHADIKSNNALLFRDGSVRLSDFTLSVKKWSQISSFKHSACTITHAPIEMLQGDSWDYSLDIWSLGCTFYELAYGELLFPYQGKGNDNKADIKKKSISCILHWAKVSEISDGTVKSSFLPSKLSSRFNNVEYTEFNKLLLKMLQIKQENRPTIVEVLQDPFFNGLTRTPACIISTVISSLSSQERNRIIRYIDVHSDNVTVQSLAYELYSRSTGIVDINEAIKALTCTWIACKLVGIKLPKLQVSRTIVLQAERVICQYLSFRLHTAINNNINITKKN